MPKTTKEIIKMIEDLKIIESDNSFQGDYIDEEYAQEILEQLWFSQEEIKEIIIGLKNISGFHMHPEVLESFINDLEHKFLRVK